MREIKFRGKTRLSIEELNDREIEHTDGWIIGNLIVNGDKPMIVGDLIEVDPEYIVHEQWCSVIPETVDQYTGLKDNNGIEIYEGDVITNELYKREGLAFVVYYDNEKGMFKQRPFIFENNGKKLGNKDLTLQMDSVSNKEIIGNIYENPELLGDAK